MIKNLTIGNQQKDIMPSPLERVYVEITAPTDIEVMWKQLKQHPKFDELPEKIKKNLEKAFLNKNGHRIEKYWRDWYGGKRKWTEVFGNLFSNLSDT